MSSNIARHLERMAAALPAATALKIPNGRSAGKIDYLSLSFSELSAEADAWAAQCRLRGIGPGDRTLVMVRPGLPLIASVFALFRIGAVPVVIDPGMGLRSFLSCVRQSKPSALVGIPMAQLASRLFRGSFASVRSRASVNGSLTFRFGSGAAPYPAIERKPEDLAAVLFTSGSTGAPKGVAYEHGMFEAQVEIIRAAYDIQPGEIDLPLLPLFALFNPALGMTSVIPELDPRRPAAADPAKLVQAILQEGVTSSFGSPTLWRKIAVHCQARAITLPSLRRVLCAGAPVPSDLWEASIQLLPNGLLHSPYGATEALPVATVCSREIDFNSTTGACVGRPVTGVQVMIIAPNDGPIAQVGQVQELHSGSVGEIIVAGPMVTKAYDRLPEATKMAKIADSSVPGGLWHRTGDCGFLDLSGNLWFCGRKAERVLTAEGLLDTEPCEQIFRVHPRARRCALVGIPVKGSSVKIPAIVVESRPLGPAEAQRLAGELRSLGRSASHTRFIRRFHFKPHFPVDVRHNAKINRLSLALWVSRAPAYEIE